MTGVDRREPSFAIELDDSPEKPAQRGKGSHATRESARSARKAWTRLPTPELWTKKHPDWAKDWRIPLSYSRNTVDKDDVARLDEGQFLNDNLIGFYLRYLHDQLEKGNPAIAKRVYFHNSFFYEKLRQPNSRQINYDGVKKWTAKIDLLSYDYIVVPVNEHAHWWVAIICNAPKLLPGSDKPGDSEKAPGAAGSDQDAEAPAPRDGSVEIQDIQEISDRQHTAPEDAAAASSSSPHVSPQTENMTENLSQMTINGLAPVLEKTKAFQDLTEDVPDKDSGHVNETLDDNNDITEVQGNVLLPMRGRHKKGVRKSLGRKYDPKEPRIITLDSLGNPHNLTVSHLKQYLIAEIREKKGIELEDPGSLGVTANTLPLQENFCDCGVYLLLYIQEFIKDPDMFVTGILQKEKRKLIISAPSMRDHLRDLILNLQKEQQAREDAERKRKAGIKRSKERGDSRGTTVDRNTHQGTPRSGPPTAANSTRGTPSISDAKEPKKAPETARQVRSPASPTDMNSHPDVITVEDDSAVMPEIVSLSDKEEHDDKEKEEEAASPNSPLSHHADGTDQKILQSIEDGGDSGGQLP